MVIPVPPKKYPIDQKGFFYMAPKDTQVQDVSGCWYDVILGDCIDGMRLLDDASVNTCVTSPPYFGLRDYGVAGQIGLESEVSDYIARLVDVFREVRRVLREDGTLWVNLGDSYARAGGWSNNNGLDDVNRAEGTRAVSNTGGKRTSQKLPSGFKQKDLLGIPWRVALALQADGWYLRQDIIWHKPNPVPENVKDRCTKSHEYLFLLSKSARYHFDETVMQETATSESGKYATRNKRSVWVVPTRAFNGAHFAVFPPDLIAPCILAGCPEGGTVLDPFGGSGTTAGVALKHGRNAVLCELNPDYAILIDDRVDSIRFA